MPHYKNLKYAFANIYLQIHGWLGEQQVNFMKYNPLLLPSCVAPILVFDTPTTATMQVQMQWIYPYIQTQVNFSFKNSAAMILTMRMMMITMDDDDCRL